MSKKIFAKKGDRVLGPDGLPVAIVRFDLETNTLLRQTDFNWLVKRPKHGEPLDVVPGFRILVDGRPQACINGKWLP